MRDIVNARPSIDRKSAASNASVRLPNSRRAMRKMKTTITAPITALPNRHANCGRPPAHSSVVPAIPTTPWPTGSATSRSGGASNVVEPITPAECGSIACTRPPSTAQTTCVSGTVAIADAGAGMRACSVSRSLS
jgi:hypothetical protein